MRLLEYVLIQSDCCPFKKKRRQILGMLKERGMTIWGHAGRCLSANQGESIGPLSWPSSHHIWKKIHWYCEAAQSMVRCYGSPSRLTQCPVPKGNWRFRWEAYHVQRKSELVALSMNGSATRTTENPRSNWWKPRGTGIFKIYLLSIRYVHAETLGMEKNKRRCSESLSIWTPVS